MRRGFAPWADRNARPLLRFDRLTKRFGGVVAVDRLSLDIYQGEFFALLGPSGCGKTTLLRLIAGFETPDEGSLLLGGDDIAPVPPYRRPVNMMFQSYALFPHMTVAGNVAFGLKQDRLPRPEIEARVAKMLALVKLEALASRKPHQLSGGQRQRVALARALAKEPRVLLLDEPLSALDALVRVQLREEIRRVQTELGITTLFVTHDQSEALSMADRVGVMHQGKLEQLAAPAELYARPATAFVAEFVGTMNHLPGVMNGDTVTVNGRHLPVDGEAPAAGTSVDVLVRPEALRLRADENGEALVLSTTFMGAVTRIRVRLTDGVEAVADLGSHAAATLTAGAKATLELDERPVLVAEPAS
jgi:putative spermidine/putrescine transport system ATP-binding protein